VSLGKAQDGEEVDAQREIGVKAKDDFPLSTPLSLRDNLRR
jgi:hypothetical protein